MVRNISILWAQTCALCCLMLLNIYQTYTWVFGFHWCNHGLTYVKFYFQNCIRNCICIQCGHKNLILSVKSKFEETFWGFPKLNFALILGFYSGALNMQRYFPHEWISYQGRSCLTHPPSPTEPHCSSPSQQIFG